jgi:tetratricopeptide (TPR) repeat protein
MMMAWRKYICGVAVVLAIVASVVTGRVAAGGLFRYAQQLWYEREHASAEYLLRAEKFAESGDNDSAFWNLQMALANGVDNAQRSMAGLKMAQFLLTLAKKEQAPYALMARQYAEAVLGIETDRDLRYQTYRVLMELAVVMGDTQLADESSEAGLRFAPGRPEASEFAMRKVEAMLALKKMGSLRRLFDEASAYNDLPGFCDMMVLLKARAFSILRDDQGLLRDWCGADDDSAPEAVLAALKAEVQAGLEKMVQEDSQDVASEALFQLAAMRMADGQYAQADVLLERFLMMESSTHQSEVLLLMARIARNEGMMARAERMLDVFVKRFSWNKVAADEFVAVVQEMTRRGRHVQVLDLIDKYMAAGLVGKLEPDLFLLAARTAKDANLKSRAMEYYGHLDRVAREDKDRIESLRERGKILMDQGRLADARLVYLEYLRKFPYEAQQDDVYYRLFEIVSVSSNVPPEDILCIASAAALSHPNDIRTRRVMLSMAGMLEEMSLYDMAREQYGKIALLHYLSDGTGQVSVAESGLVFEAMLGSARCYSAMGEEHIADGIFRDLCNNQPSSTVRSHAAYAWALMAMSEAQIPEATRRFALVDAENLDESTRNRVRFEESMLDLAGAEFNTSTFDHIASLVMRAVEKDRTFLFRRFSRQIMDALDRKGDLDGMVKFFEWAAASEQAGLLPLVEIHMRTGSRLLKESGVEVYGAFMSRTSEAMSGRYGDYGKDLKTFMGMVDGIEQLKKAKATVL